MNVQEHLNTLSLTLCKQKQIKYVPSPSKASLSSLPCLCLFSLQLIVYLPACNCDLWKLCLCQGVPGMALLHVFHIWSNVHRAPSGCQYGLKTQYIRDPALIMITSAHFGYNNLNTYYSSL